MKTFEEVKLHNKDFEDMELLELYAERSARNWHRSRIKRCIELLKTRKWWLENNMPIYSPEEIKRQYEDGEISKTQYQTAFARRKRAINQRMKNDDRMIFAERIVYHESSIIAFLDELIAEKLAKEDKGKPKKKTAGYDPRRKSGYDNVPPPQIDPQRRWATRDKDPKPFPKLQHAKMRWKKGKKDDNTVTTIMKRMQPIITWDADKLMEIAKDRGYFTDYAVMAAVAEALNITLSGADKLLQSGKMSWGQCMVIGAIFEMTPKEYCDVFMSGYFKEVADGVFKAHVEDTEALLDVPYRAKPKIEEGDDSEDD